jgi:glycosyltransferase involved in cell wall biosynthesis
VSAGLSVERGAAVVCVPVRRDNEQLGRTLRSVLAHTDSAIPIVVCREAATRSPAHRLLAELDQEAGRRIVELEHGLDGAIAFAAPADVVVLDPGCEVAAGWLEGLRRTAYSDSTVATATALTGRDLGPSPRPVPDTAGALREPASVLRPRLAAPRAPCVYVRRTALDLVADPTADPAPPDPTVDAFARSCIEGGLSHLLADEVVVDAADPARLHPFEDADGPLQRALGGARRSRHGLSAAIDARILSGPVTGTQVHVLELIEALARTESMRLSAIVPDEPNDHAKARLGALRTVSLITYEQASHAGRARSDLIHRPFNLTNAGDLQFLESIGDRLILTQEDLIAFRNPAYFPAAADWMGHRTLTRLALTIADRVVFSTAYTRDDAIAQELVEPDRASIVPLGTDHQIAALNRGAVRPARMGGLGEQIPVMLCLGTDFLHKNRVFALRLLDRLCNSHRWDGVLVLAGPVVPYGSSKAREQSLIARRPALTNRVIDLGPVSETEKAWLFERSALVVYPSVLEGFGLVPFEAGAHGVPCMWAPGSSLSDLLPDSAAEIVAWDAEESAERALALMRRPEQRERNLGAIRDAAAPLTWDATAQILVDLYHATCNAPPSPVRVLGPSTAGSITEDAMRLVGPGGELPPDLHRPLLALATHRRFAAPVFAALKLGYRASYEFRRRRRRRS